MLGRDVLALRQLEHVLDAVHHLQRARRRELAYIARVEEAVRVCGGVRMRAEAESASLSMVSQQRGAMQRRSMRGHVTCSLW
jgi:hypothetical protein